MKKALLILALFVSASGCSKLLGQLRADLDDYPEEQAAAPANEPTIGGKWSEKGQLSADSSVDPSYYERNQYPAHAERGPASAGGPGKSPEQQSSWVSADQADAARRDRYRFADGEALAPTAGLQANVAPTVRRQYKNGDRATKDDFIDDGNVKGTGSLWASDGQTNYFFTKNKIRGPGDIVNLTLEPAIVGDIVTESKRTLSVPEMERELAVIQERINAQYLPLIQKAEADLEAKKLAEKEDKKKKDKDSITTVASAPAAGDPSRNPASANPNPANPTNPNAANPAEAATASAGAPASGDLLANEMGAILPAGVKTTKLVVGEKDYIVPRADPNDVNIAPQLEIKGGDTMMTEITERYPNGNYKIRGIKKINFKGGPPRFMQITGIVKGTDITEDDNTSSGKLYEYRVEGLR